MDQGRDHIEAGGTKDEDDPQQGRDGRDGGGADSGETNRQDTSAVHTGETSG
jgi:hypothetical protein